MNRTGRTLPPVALLTGAAVAIALAAPAPAAAQAVLEDEVAAQVRRCANEQRAKHGLGPLVENRVLDRAAAYHARNMARHDFFGHDDPQGRGPAERVDLFGDAAAYQVVGENIAAGEPSPAEACRDWMRSPGHRSNILDPQWRSMGGGFAIGHTGLRYYYVQEFGRTNLGGPPPPGARRTGPKVVVRLSQAGDALTLRLDGRRLAVARRGQSVDVPLGRVDPRARITVEARSVSGELSWDIEERSDGRRVYGDRRAGAPASATVVDLATGAPPLVHRVTLDARGRVLRSFTTPLPAATLWGAGAVLGDLR